MNLANRVALMRSGDNTAFSLFAYEKHSTKDQTKKTKPGATYFCARNIVDRLYTLATKRLYAAKARAAKQKKGHK